MPVPEDLSNQGQKLRRHKRILDEQSFTHSLPARPDFYELPRAFWAHSMIALRARGCWFYSHAGLTSTSTAAPKLHILGLSMTCRKASSIAAGVCAMFMAMAIFMTWHDKGGFETYVESDCWADEKIARRWRLERRQRGRCGKGL
jgi:hypothetical protein